MRVLIIGRGNVAVNLDYAFLKQGVNVEMHSSREGLDSLPQNADVCIYAVRDSALAAVVSQVRMPARVLHLHTSGTMPLSVFGSDKPHAGIIYPFQTFSKERLIEDFSSVPVFVEARGIDDVSAACSLALMITPHVSEASQHDRERLHAAGVLVNNFPNLLYTLARELLQTTRIPFSALLPLIDETAAKVHVLTPEEAQTGPARRNDKEVMEKHLSLLLTDEQREVYRLLSRCITNRYNTDKQKDTH